MGRLTRDYHETLDQMRPGTYTSDRGWPYRLLPSTEISGAWLIYPDLLDLLPWLGAGYPGFIAVPQPGYGMAVHKRNRDGSTGDRIGYGSDLADICWPAEDYLIAVMRTRPADDTAVMARDCVTCGARARRGCKELPPGRFHDIRRRIAGAPGHTLQRILTDDGTDVYLNWPAGTQAADFDGLTGTDDLARVRQPARPQGDPA